MIECPLYILAALLVVSLVEYFGHRYGLHRPQLSLGKDHLAHHKLFARDFLHKGETPEWYDWYLVRGAFGLLWTALIWIPLLCISEYAGAAIFALMGTLHTLIWQWTHNEMHRPETLWLQRNRWFQFIRTLHRIHHERPRTNFAFVFFPFWDWVFRTYRSADAHSRDDRSLDEGETGSSHC